jgi:O-antigen/teichoic acid export membrane protein
MIWSIFSISFQISILEEFGKEGYGQFFNTIFRLSVTGLLFSFFFITMFSEFIISILTTSNFHAAYRYIPILTLGAVFTCIAGIVGNNFAAVRKSKYFLYSCLLTLIVAIICNIVLIPYLGLLGAAISVPISLIILVISRILYARKLVVIKNIYIYLLDLILAILTIIVTLYIQIAVLQYVISIILFLLFICINHDLKKYILIACQEIKLKVFIKTT